MLKRIVLRVRTAWPEVEIVFRADSHHSKPEVVEWLEARGIQFITGLTPNRQLAALFEADIRMAGKKHREQRHSDAPSVPIPADSIAPRLGADPDAWLAASRSPPRARMSATSSPPSRRRERNNYDTVYCGRGKMELMIKDHKTALKSDRTSCHRKETNQFRLFLHFAAYVLMHALRANLLKGSELAMSSSTPSVCACSRSARGLKPAVPSNASISRPPVQRRTS